MGPSPVIAPVGTDHRSDRVGVVSVDAEAEQKEKGVQRVVAELTATLLSCFYILFFNQNARCCGYRIDGF